MNSLAHRYTDFGPIISNKFDALPAEIDALEGMRLRQFEAGYQAGWDDASAAAKNEQLHISSEFAQNLQDMSFGYVEASSKLTAALKPMVEQMLANLLPQIAQQALPHHVLEQVMALLSPDPDQPAQIQTAPENAPAIRAILEDQPDLPFELQTDETLGPVQVFLSVKQREREINFEEVLTTMAEALDAFFQHSQERMSNG